MTPLKLLIVDDEPNILAGLVKTFPWGKWGYQVIGSATNGYLALDLIEEYHPDVVITDILMKQMTGLELIEKSLVLFPDTIFIVISAYRDFDYAKEACRLGAHTYLLKPLTEEALKETMLSVKAACLQHQEQNLLAKNYNTFLNKHASGYICALLRSFIQDQTTEEEFLEALSFVDKDWNSMHYICVCATIDPYINIYPSKSELYILLQYLKKNLNKCFDGYTFEDQDSKLILLITIPAGSIMHRNKLEELFRDFKRLFQMEVTYSVSKEYSKVSDIKKAAQEAGTLFAMADDAGLDRLYPESILENYKLPGAPFQYPKNHALLVLKSIRSLNIPAARKALGDFIIELSPITDTEYQKLCIQRLTLEILSSFIEPSFPATLRYSFENFIRDFNNIPVLKTIPVLNQHINELMKHLEKRSCFDTSEVIGTYVEQAKLYAANHISDEQLNVTTIAEELHLNAVYFGRIFKKSTGIGFKTYLLNLRMEEARRLLTESSLSIMKITEQIGFANTSYFSQLFKANVGCLPNEYRKGVIHEE